MTYVPVATGILPDLAGAAGRRWQAVQDARPDLAPAIGLQRGLLTIVTQVGQTIEQRPLPRLSLPPRYLAAKLAKGVPALAGEPIPLPVTVLQPALLQLCTALADGGAGETARHIKDAVESGNVDISSLLTASLMRNQIAIRTGAIHRGLAPDLVWLIAELASSPFAHKLQTTLLGTAAEKTLQSALQAWSRGYCPACGSWPALAEVVGGRRTLRCSYCACAWELPSYACIYCEEAGEKFVTAAQDEERKDRRVEVCSACGGYLKTIDLPELSPFPLLAISDLETTDLDAAAMEHGYARPPLREFQRSSAAPRA
jgi:FdhE protein